MFYSVRKGRAKDAYMHHIVCQLFWLHVEADCTLKLRWVPSKDNAVANALTRPETSQHFRLGGRGYGSYGHDCVLTAAPYFRRGARRAPTILFKTPHRRKLWHRCFSAGRWAYAVLYGPMFRLLPPPPPHRWLGSSPHVYASAVRVSSS